MVQNKMHIAHTSLMFLSSHMDGSSKGNILVPNWKLHKNAIDSKYLSLNNFANYDLENKLIKSHFYLKISFQSISITVKSQDQNQDYCPDHCTMPVQEWCHSGISSKTCSTVSSSGKNAVIPPEFFLQILFILNT